MFLSSLTKKIQLAAIALILVIVAGFFFEARAQRPGTAAQPLRDMVRAIERKEMDRLILLKPLPSVSDEPARQLVLKQIREDFRDLQNLNNKMMSEAWARETVNYGLVSDMISQIKGKANRLKLNLNLPVPEATKGERSAAPVNDKDFRASLMLLDQTIMRFVKNPVFQSPNTIEVTQATQARQDLEAVIELATGLRKVASRLGKVGNR